jgi:hypothetical protein
MKFLRYASVILTIALATSCLMAADRATAYRASRTADGKPDLNGIWQSLNTANWDVEGHAARASQVVAPGAAGAVPAGLGVVEGNEIPYLPAALAKKRENFEKQANRRPREQVLSPGRPPRHLHAFSVSDCADAESHPDRLRIR